LQHVGKFFQNLAKVLDAFDLKGRLALFAKTLEHRLNVLSCYSQEIIVPIVQSVRVGALQR
jgi:hypothetical protein